jgi:hypothetical protein
MMVSCPYRYDTVDDMDIGDGDRDGSPVRTTNLPSSSLANANNQLEIRTFSYYAIVGLGEIAQRSGGCGRETLKLGVGFGCYVCIGNLHFETARPRDVFFGEPYRWLWVESESQGGSSSGEQADCQGIKSIGNSV